ncbi:hypothetical protein HZB74_00415 [Candidatus Saccharibacteria bacterium]|nr:hypothetical protein [Candidatus Saccharibacteria bacterium]
MHNLGNGIESKLAPLREATEFVSDNWMKISGCLTIVGVSLGLIGVPKANAATVEGREFVPPEGGYRKIPRYKKFDTSQKALTSILQEFNEDAVDLPPMPEMSEDDKTTYRSCMFGDAGKVFLKGDIETARIDEDSVGITLNLMDDCQKSRVIRTVVGLESRENSKENFKPVNTPTGIIKYIGSSPEYGSYYFDSFGNDQSCVTNPDVEFKFTVNTVSRGNYAPLTIRTRAAKRMPIIDCEIK